MFKVIYLGCELEYAVYTVYAVSGTQFLIWEHGWVWKDMEEFQPEVLD